MATTGTVTARPKPALKRLMWIGMLVLCVIAAAVVVRRIAALVSPPKNVPAQLAGLDQIFASKEALTLTHIIPGLAFVIIIPFQLSRSWRNRHLRAHRWMGRVVMILGVTIAVSALGMSTNPIGAAIEASATIFFDLFFLFALTKAYLHIRWREIALHREWVIRAMAIALGIATVRPVIGFFFATSRLTGLTPHQFFGIAFWIGFSLTYLGGELWVRYTRLPMRA